MNILYQIPGLEELEEKNDWIRIIDKMEYLETNCSNINILLRISTEYWYILSNCENDRNLEVLNLQSIQKRLMKMYAKGKILYKSNSSFLWMFGYMISLFPYYFYFQEEPKDKYIEWEIKGNEMIRMACDVNSSDRIAKLVYNNMLGYEVIDICAQKQIVSSFNGNTLVEKYFREVLLNPIV